MKMKIILLLSILVIFSCSDPSSEDIPDVSHISESHQLVRFEQSLFGLDTNNLDTELKALIDKHPAFSELFFTNIFPIDLEDPQALKTILAAESMIKLKDTTEFVFKNFSRIDNEFSKAFKYLKYYFNSPKGKQLEAPNLYTFISEFGYQRFLFQDETGKDAIGIGLDLFLGGDYPYKAIDPTNPAFSEYLTRSFNKEHLVKKCMELYIEDLMGPAPGNRMLDQMIHNGKKLYVLDKILPTTHDSILLGYTAGQVEWVDQNQLEMWAFFLKEELFYEANSLKISKYINPSPNSPKMPESAPGMTANFLGWKIVEAYMKKNPSLDMIKLIKEKNAQKILDESKFKPRK